MISNPRGVLGTSVPCWVTVFNPVITLEERESNIGNLHEAAILCLAKVYIISCSFLFHVLILGFHGKLSFFVVEKIHESHNVCIHSRCHLEQQQQRQQQQQDNNNNNNNTNHPSTVRHSLAFSTVVVKGRRWQLTGVGSSECLGARLSPNIFVFWNLFFWGGKRVIGWNYPPPV